MLERVIERAKELDTFTKLKLGDASQAFLAKVLKKTDTFVVQYSQNWQSNLAEWNRGKCKRADRYKHKYSKLALQKDGL